MLLNVLFLINFITLFVLFRDTADQGCYRYFPKVSPIFDIDTGLKSIVDTDIDTLP